MAAGASHDVTVLACIRAGDETALAAAYALHADVVYGVARRVTRDEHLARDITQEVFAYLWELPQRVDLSRGSLRCYLSVVAHRRAVDEVRRSVRRGRGESALAVAPLADGPEDGVVESHTQRWRDDRLGACLARLPADQRAAVELAYFDGLTYRQVASVLGVPEGTAKSRLRLAMARLRLLLGDDVRAVI